MKLLEALVIISLLTFTGFRRGWDSPRKRGYWLVAGVFIASVPCVMAGWLGGGNAVYFVSTMLSAGFAYGFAAEYGSRKRSVTGGYVSEIEQQ